MWTFIMSAAERAFCGQETDAHDTRTQIATESLSLANHGRDSSLSVVEYSPPAHKSVNVARFFSHAKICWYGVVQQCRLRGDILSLSIKPSCSKLKRCTTTEIRWNKKRRCSNIPGRLHQSPAAQLAQELKSIPVDWAVGLHRNRVKFTCDESTAYLTTYLDAAVIIIIIISENEKAGYV